MGYKISVLFIALLAGSLAAPSLDVDNDSDFFYHTDPEARIVGGTQAADGAVPHMVGMTTGLLLKTFVCGGSLVSRYTVLTAAHCIQAVYSRGKLVSSLRVTVGTNRWNSGGRAYSLSRNVTYPHYVHSIIKNDLGLLITTSPVVLSPKVAPVTIGFDHVGGGVPAIVAGWGKTRVSGGSLSARLLELHLNTISGSDCIKEVERASKELGVNAPPVDPNLEICTFHSPSHGTCNGDSGSALVLANRRIQVGIVSWGFPCARGAPDMFARVSGFSTWLSENILF